MKDAILRLRGVNTHIGEYHVLQGVDLVTPRRGVTALLGRNGAGKTTTLRTVMGMWRASRGHIEFDGQDITSLPTWRIARLGIAYVPESLALFHGLTVQENIHLAARSGVRDSGRLDWIFSVFPALKALWSKRAAYLSGGQKQMLAIARAIVEPSKLILVDEPVKGLAPAVVEELKAAFHALKQQNTAMLLVEQNFDFARDLADWATILDSGRVGWEGEMASLAADPALQHRLLGLSMGFA